MPVHPHAGPWAIWYIHPPPSLTHTYSFTCRPIHMQAHLHASPSTCQPICTPVHPHTGPSGTSTHHLHSLTLAHSHADPSACKPIHTPAHLHASPSACRPIHMHAGPSTQVHPHNVSPPHIPLSKLLTMSTCTHTPIPPTHPRVCQSARTGPSTPTHPTHPSPCLCTPICT